MNRIQDKKRWFAATCCKQHIKAPDTPMAGIGLSIGLVGGLFVGIALLFAFAPVLTDTLNSLALMFPPQQNLLGPGLIGFGGILKSDLLKAKKTEKVTAANAIIESATDEKPLTDEQRTTVDGILAEIKVLNGDISRTAAIEAQLVDAVDMSADTRRPAMALDAGTAAEPRIEIVRNGSLKYFKTEKDAFTAGQWMMAAIYGKTSAHKWCKANGVPVVRDSANEGTNSQGGYLVPNVLESVIIDLREEYGSFRRFAKVKQMASNLTSTPRRSGGLTAYPVLEGVAPTESQKSWSQVSLAAKKWAVLTRYSSEVSEDAVIDIAQDLGFEVGYAFAVSEDNAGFSGDGTSTYHGVVGLARKFFDANVGSFKGAVSAAATHNTFAEIDGDDLDAMIAVLPLYARRNARFYCSPQFKSLVFDAIARAAGGNTKVDVAGKPMDAYMGYPIEQAVAAPSGITTDYDEQSMCYFGDMMAAVTMGTRRGVSIAVSTEKYFDTDEIGIRGTERFDINVHDIGDSSNAGPLVALIGEAS